MSHDILTKRPISHDEAREIAQRLINSHFRNEPHARASIPAKPDYDDDLLISAYIEQQRRGGLGDRALIADRLRQIIALDRRVCGTTSEDEIEYDGDLGRIAREALAALDRAGPFFDLIAHIARQRAFSLKTFGPGQRTKGVIDHIRKELREIEAKPLDLSEWVDVILLAIDGAHRAGHSPEAIAAVIAAKQTKNESRDWPDWRTADPDKAIEHVRAPHPCPRVDAVADDPDGG
jgi:hypothetical protein